jgi:hypothetical protein
MKGQSTIDGKEFKLIGNLLLHLAIVFALVFIFTFGIGFLLKAELFTSNMVFQMGFLILKFAIPVNLIFLILTIMTDYKWLRLLFAYFPVLLSFLLIFKGLNAAWTPTALFFTLLLANTFWIFRLHKTATNNSNKA